MSGPARRHRPVHAALVHRSSDQLVGALLPYVREGLALGEPVYVNLAGARLDALRSALGAAGGAVVWTDTADWYPSPGPRFRALEDLLEEHRRHGRPGRFVGECALPPGPAELVAEWLRFDAALDAILEGSRVQMLCAFDATTLPAGLLDAALGVHGDEGMLSAGRSLPGSRPSVTSLDRADLALSVDAASRVDLAPPAARAFARALLAGDLPEEDLEEVLLVVSELVTNSWQAGATTVRLSLWRRAEGLLVQVDDNGTGLEDPLAGYRRPPLHATGGRGLWIARQLADAVEVAADHTGTSIRVHRVPARRSAMAADTSRGE